jgi:hypothetical protein
MVGRRVVIPADTDWRGRPVREHDEWLIVPICLPCWLMAIERPWWSKVRGMPERHRSSGEIRDYLSVDDSVRRLRCEACARPLRVVTSRSRVYLSERVCCRDCLRRMRNERNNECRRVEHHKVRCAVCKKTFVQKRGDARTCSNTCRQRLFRQQQRAQRVASRAG